MGRKKNNFESIKYNFGITFHMDKPDEKECVEFLQKFKTKWISPKLKNFLVAAVRNEKTKNTEESQIQNTSTFHQKNELMEQCRVSSKVISQPQGDEQKAESKKKKSIKIPPALAAEVRSYSYSEELRQKGSKNGVKILEEHEEEI